LQKQKNKNLILFRSDIVKKKIKKGKKKERERKREREGSYKHIESDLQTHKDKHKIYKHLLRRRGIVRETSKLPFKHTSGVRKRETKHLQTHRVR